MSGPNVQHLVIEHSENDPEAFICRSEDMRESGESRNVEEAIQYVKGVTLVALSTLWKKIPDDVHIKFEIDWSRVQSEPEGLKGAHCDHRLGLVPSVIACKRKPTFVCGCTRCGSEDEDGKFHSCHEHRVEVEERHARIYPRHRVFWFGIR